MSRTNPNQSTRPTNPCKYFLQWNGGEGVFSYYDKELKNNIHIPPGLMFIVLDELNSFKGYNEDLKTGIYSNEVRNLKKEPLTVRYFKGSETIAEGLYEAIKDKVMSKSVGGTYCKSVYVAWKLPSTTELILGNIQFTGSGVQGYFEFTKENGASIYTSAIQNSNKRPEKNGATNYFVPEFKIMPISTETDEKAGELQRELAEYLKLYFEYISGENQVPSHEEVENVKKSASELSHEIYKSSEPPIELFQPDHLGEDNLPF